MSTAPYEQPHAEELRHASDGVCEGVQCARQRSYVGGQTRLTTYFGELEPTSQQLEKIAESLNFVSLVGA